MTGDCFTCLHGAHPAGPRDRVLLTEHWRAAHADRTGLPGWLVLVPLRHVTALDELTAAESAELGPLLAGLTAALRQVTGCAKTYVLLLAEQEGFSHVHFHVVPRAADLAPELIGPGILTLLHSDDPVPDAEQDRLAGLIGAAMPAIQGSSTAGSPIRGTGGNRERPHDVARRARAVSPGDVP